MTGNIFRTRQQTLFADTGKVNDRKRSGRPRTTRMPQAINDEQNALDILRGNSAKQICKNMRVNHSQNNTQCNYEQEEQKGAI